MAKMLLHTFLVSLLASLAWTASMRLPSFPLAVKTPYLSVWLPGHLSHDFPSATPQFWEGQPLTWVIMARLHDTTYCLLGCPGGRPGVKQATQKSLNFTSTHTYVTLEAGSTQLTMDFFSPVDPVDHVRQSLPFSYVTVSAADKHGKPVDVVVISAIDASWLAQRGASYADISLNNGTHLLMLDGEDGAEFSEDREMALWGKAVLAGADNFRHSKTACRVGSPDALLGMFIESGDLAEFDGSMQHGGLAACSQQIPSYDHSRAVFAVGLYQDNEMQYFDGEKIEHYVGYFRSRVSNITEAVNYFLEDYEDALAESHKFDQKIVDIGMVTSSNYSDLLEFTIRQSFAGQQVMISADTLDTSHPYSFIKEISTDGNVNTLADLIPKALPVFHVLNPKYTRMFLEPVFRFSKNAWPLNHAVHDIGKAYPNATGETPCIEEFLPLDSTSVLLWMLYLYQDATGDTELTEDYAPILRRYADYCVRYGLYPIIQRSSVDALGAATNQSALSISAAIALNAYGKMTGHANYSEAGITMAQEILDIGRDAGKTHFLAHYTDDDESWVLMYPLAFDAWLKLDTFPKSVYKTQSDWYSQRLYPFGVQYRHNIRYTLMEWMMWVAAVSPDPLRDHLVNGVHRFLDQDTAATESVPGPTQWRVVPGADEGVWTHFSKAKSVIGSIFMIAAVQGGFNQTSVAVSRNRPVSTMDKAVPQSFLPIDDKTASVGPLVDSELTIPFYLPKGASKPVDAAFLGLSFDMADFPKYIGNTSATNTASIELIRNLVKTADTPLTIRIGGSEGDSAFFDAIQPSPVRRIDVSGRSTLSIGPSYFESIRALTTIPRLNWIYQVPFASLNRPNAVAGARQAAEAMGQGHLYAFEIGHKSNLYAGASRPDNYGCRKYAEELYAFKVALRNNIPGVGRKFQALGLSHHQIHDDWTAEECFTVGIEAQDDLKSVSAHYSHFNSSRELRSSKKLPQHSAIVHEHKKFLSQVEYVNKVFSCHPFVISEASLVSATDKDYREGGSKPDDATVLGITLWNLDFLLYAMSKNVSKVLMHQSCDSMSSAWTPEACHAAGSTGKGEESHVNGPYSALTFVTSFVRGAGHFQVVPIRESDGVVVYAGYESGKLAKIAIVNYPSVKGEEVDESEVLELRLPDEDLSVRQTAKIDLAHLGQNNAGLTQSVRSGGEAQQVPIRDERRPGFEVRDGMLSVQLGEAGALLLEV